MGCPRGITDKKYDRNTLIFNFGFVFDKDCDTAPFESVVRKLGATFTIYEVVQAMNLSALLVLVLPVGKRFSFGHQQTQQATRNFSSNI